MKNKKLNDNELEQVNGGLVPPYPPTGSSKDEPVFKGTFDGNGKTVHLNIDLDPGPQEYDCGGLIS